MQVEDRGFLAERHFVEERNYQPKFVMDELPVAKPHRNDEIVSVDQLLRQPLWHMGGRIGPFLDQPFGNDRVDRFGFGFDSRRFNSIGGLLAELCP